MYYSHGFGIMPPTIEGHNGETTSSIKEVLNNAQKAKPSIYESVEAKCTACESSRIFSASTHGSDEKVVGVH